MWDIAGRGATAAIYVCCIFLGPSLGPIIAGLYADMSRPRLLLINLSSSITESHLGWRWVFWVMMIFAGACTLLAIIILPETYAPVLLRKKVCVDSIRISAT